MSPPQTNPRQPLIAAWGAQMIGTIVIAIVVLAFVRSLGGLLSNQAQDFQRYAMVGILVAATPALYYLRTFKTSLKADEAALVERNGLPDPKARAAMTRSLAIGGVLCELPMAAGVINLMLGGDTRWFVGATFITVAIRLSYRPFLSRSGR